MILNLVNPVIFSLDGTQRKQIKFKGNNYSKTVIIVI